MTQPTEIDPIVLSQSVLGLLMRAGAKGATAWAGLWRSSRRAEKQWSSPCSPATHSTPPMLLG
jgi:hypothetical protein